MKGWHCCFLSTLRLPSGLNRLRHLFCCCWRGSNRDLLMRSNSFFFFLGEEKRRIRYGTCTSSSLRHLPLARQSSTLVLSLWSWLGIGQPSFADYPSLPQRRTPTPTPSYSPSL